MEFVTPDNFDDTPYSIPSQEVQSDSFESYIPKKQKEILEKILGIELYDQFMEAIAEDYPDEKWTNLRDGAKYVYCGVTYRWKGLESLLVPFIASQWLRDTYDNYTTSGISVSKVENADKISPALRIVQAHNDFHRMQGNCNNWKNTLWGFMKANEGDYPDWVFTDIGTMNRFNL